MIRRDVLFADGRPGWLLIEQPAHARLSRWLAERCAVPLGGDLAPSEARAFRDDVFSAIELHDDGWRAWESCPAIDAAARDGDPSAIAFPRGLTGPRDAKYNYSFSGLKTAVKRWLAANPQAPVADVAASFQEAVADVLSAKAVAACRDTGMDTLILGGGVAANSRLRALTQSRCDAAGIRLRVPRPALCTDNGAMVAALGAEMVARGRPPSGWLLGADSSLPVVEPLVP